ncbi:Stk1 family PASTA domain-containing Ser/Thr kinase [Shimazuella sp. AN120528]|uniref:Stk1 family PASTA domain-containing Ser/Thr kinase n=1 Tax=Shimazuella soli TaxID=1892854 RepID=UPI001F10BAF7|nr:Stk1 family PASTA domain-containing Ser/Thr kinase [Shimazuella soli]MCH5584872.1 Stk1 family PASTA domain-containing Ser/Thr kinase [Shimazuella soli]
MEGKKLGGRYEILSRIGGGGMAVVYKAKDILLHRNVAIKVLSESLSNDQEFVRRFDREAQAAASLSHPNIVNVYDVGQDGYIHYIVMELVEGPTLKQMILERGQLTTAEAGDIAAQICDGLQHAHDNQIVHRDIKPHNILIGTNGRAKVTDFGIARAASSSTITQTGSVMGSVHYFSPEQARGGQIGSKADIYSLGVVLYEMLTGELPFDGDSAISIALKHLQEPVIDPRELNDKIPESMVNIVMRALEKDPEMRYTSVKAMMQDINYALQFDSRRENRWERPTKTSDIFQTIPISADEETEVHNVFQPRNNKTSSYQSPVQREEVRSPRRSETKHATKVGQETMAGLERFRNVSNDKDKTVFQRTVIWLDNVQAKLPWWQKALFSLLTIGIIVFLAIYGFTLVWGLISNPNDDPNAQQTQNVSMIDFTGKTQDEAKQWFETHGLKEPSFVYGESSDENKDKVISQKPEAGTEMNSDTATKLTLGVGGASDKLKVMDFTGMFESNLSKYTNSDELGYKVDYSRSRCYNKNTTDKNLQQGQILEQTPKPGDTIEKGGTVYLWIYAPSSSGCNDLPPSMGGQAKNKDSKLLAYRNLDIARFEDTKLLV